MKTDLITTIGTAIIGFLIAFFVCDMFMGDTSTFEVKTIDENVSYSLDSPNPEVFNYRALNPTVEVYVGGCTEYDDDGVCIQDQGGE